MKYDLAIGLVCITFIWISQIADAQTSVCGFNVKSGVQLKEWDLEINGRHIKSWSKSSLTDGNQTIEMKRLMNWPQSTGNDGFEGPFVWLIRGANNAYARDFLGYMNWPKTPAIYVDDDWVNNITNKAQSRWIRLAVLAHELGHCRYGHMYSRNQSCFNPDAGVNGPDVWQQEYDADVFAGEVLCKLGATLSEAQELYYYLTDEVDEHCYKHPSLKMRLNAVREGWENASCNE